MSFVDKKDIFLAVFFDLSNIDTQHDSLLYICPFYFQNGTHAKPVINALKQRSDFTLMAK